MNCQKCKKNKAYVHIDKSGGVLHLCGNCALDELSGEINQPHGGIDLNALGQILSGGIPGSPQGGHPVVTIIPVPPGGGGLPFLKQQEVPDIICPACKSSFKEFLMLGRFSCPDCYTAFDHHIRRMFASGIGSERHTGKVPARTYKKERTRQLVEQLKDQLDREVKKENYETAAKLRDTIKNLEQEVEKLP